MLQNRLIVKIVDHTTFMGTYDEITKLSADGPGLL